jgi:CMP-N,N'-diacetyllegionaminic acid synthase
VVFKKKWLYETYFKTSKKNIEAWNMSRHDLPKVFWQDAQIDIVKRKTLANLSMSGKKILPYFIKNQEVVDVDNKIDLLDLEIRLNLKKNLSKIVFDIDGVIATIQSDLDYSKSKPIKENIKKINNLYFQGFKIIFNTSRGFETGKDWKNVTRKQLKLWGVKYHKLYFVKPNGDLYIDDKAMLPSALLLNNFKKKIK